MMILSSCYAGSLVSFFSVDVFYDPPETIDELKEKVIQSNQKVIVCCEEMLKVMQNSLVESYRDLASRVIYRKNNKYVS